MQASKWLKSPVLLSAEEMALLIEAMAPAKLYSAGSVTAPDEGEVDAALFLEHYCDYVSRLRAGIKPDSRELNPYFSCCLNADPEAFECVSPTPDKQILRVCKPVIQLQHHNIDYSAADGKFHSMVLGTQTIDWGIQFSYPQLYQDPQTQKILNVEATDQFPNTALFRTLQRWVRQHTIPTPFVVQGVTINAPIRLGKECLDWVESHPDLNRKGITIDGSLLNRNRQ